MGDDMGTDHFCYVGARIDYLNLPGLADKRLKIFTQGELIYYPPHGSSSATPLRDNLRGSLGFGLSFPLNQMINLGIYYSVANFNSRVGDIERSSLIGFAFNFF